MFPFDPPWKFHGVLNGNIANKMVEKQLHCAKDVILNLREGYEFKSAKKNFVLWYLAFCNVFCVELVSVFKNTIFLTIIFYITLTHFMQF